MLTTIITDASWCPMTSVGGWAAWFKSDRVQRGVVRSGTFIDLQYSSNDAEMKAAANGLYCALDDGVAGPDDSILFQVDNSHVLQVLLGEAQKSLFHQRGREAIDVIARMRSQYRLKFSVRHVKSHRGGDGRHDVHNLCDRLAGEHMQAARRLRQGDLRNGIDVHETHETTE